MNRICIDRALPRDLARPHVAKVNVSGRLQAVAPVNRQWPNGTVLTVAFIGGTSAQRDMVKQYAPQWSAHANVRFEFRASLPATIRVSFDPSDGAWSYLGTDCAEIPANQPTMNLGWLAQDVILHEFGHCLDGGTLIDCPRDLEKYPLGIPMRDLVGTQPWVYAWKDGRIVVRKASRVWLTKRAETVRVTLRPGRGVRRNGAFMPPQELIGTADHPVLLSDGVTWRNLGELRAGDRLCSLYRQKNGKRSRLRWTSGPEYVREHVFVCEELNGPRPYQHHAHHINERMLDQRPENLQWKHESAHLRDHSTGRIDSEETTRRRRAAKSGFRHTEESKAKLSASALGRKLSDETRAKISATSKGRPQSAELRVKRLAAMQRFYAEGGRSGMFGKRASEETRTKQSESARSFYANGGKSAALGRSWSAERRAKIAAAWQKKRELASTNHVVISVEPAGVRDVYDMTVPDASTFFANGVACHNSLSLAHEHQNPSGGISWNIEAVVADLSGPPNFWDRETILHNVINKYAVDQVLGTAFDPASIMLYSFPASWTTNGFSAPWNQAISAQDGAFVGSAKMYPIMVTPPPAAARLPLFLAKGGKISVQKEVDEYELTIVVPGDYVIETAGALDVVVSLYQGNTLIRSDDDSGRGANSRIEATLNPGTYRVTCRHYSTGTGRYRVICWG